MKLPQQLFKHNFLSRGSNWIINPDRQGHRIKVRKRCNTKAAFELENGIYDTLEKREPSPYIVRSFLRLPGLNSAALMTGGSLEKRPALAG